MALSPRWRLILHRRQTSCILKMAYQRMVLCKNVWEYKICKNIALKCVRYLSTEQLKDWTLPVGYDTSISVYNSQTKCKVPLILPRGKWLYWYMCGPTVYDDAHIGHGSCYVKFDIIRRILQNFFEINVVQLMGITDIDDKIIARSKENNVEFWQLARKYENDFFEDLNDLNVLLPTTTMRVSDVIPCIIKFITKIMEHQFAYVADDGSVYFDLSKYSSCYGKLHPSQAEVYNMENSKENKRHSMDFALWKASKVNEPWWDSPWGRGRPGWHIECSAMASEIFGNQLDFHTGGIDLLFPHHENELAQSGAFHSVSQWVNYWLHSGHVHLKNEKMSKSLKNVITIRDFLSRHTADEFRIFCLCTHYRNNMEYKEEILNEASAIYHKFQAFFGQVKAYMQGQLQCASLNPSDLSKRLENSTAQVKEALADDFDTNRALEAILNLVNYVNKQFQLSAEESSVRDPAIIGAIGNHVNKFLNNLGISFQTSQEFKYCHLDSIVDSTVKFRSEIRRLAIQPSADLDIDNARKVMLGACDRLRKELSTAGVIVKDQGKESSWVFEVKKTRD